MGLLTPSWSLPWIAIVSMTSLQGAHAQVGYRSPTYTGEMLLVTGIGADNGQLEIGLSATLQKLGGLDSSVGVFVVMRSMASAEQNKTVGWVVEQTETDFLSMPEQVLRDAINEEYNVVEAVVNRITKVRPAETLWRPADGHYEYGAMCEDTFPCDDSGTCWRENSTQQTCGKLHAEQWCVSPHWADLGSPGPGWTAYAAETPSFTETFENWLRHESWSPTWEAVRRRRRAGAGPDTASRVCCTCGGGRCGDGSKILFPGESNFCAPCPAGTSSVGPNSPLCFDCAPGTYTGEAGVAECDNCPRGQYGDIDGMTACLRCDPGYVAAPPGTDPNLGIPDLLPTDDYTGAAIECTLCAAGRQSAGRGDKCIPCQPGSASNATGTGRCPACPPGRFVDSILNTECLACPVGRFARPFGEFDGPTTCLPCEPGTFTDVEGTSQCLDCPPGRYQDASGTTACLECEPGYFDDGGGNTECKICPGGSETRVRGASSCDPCVAGEYKPDNAFNCTLCEVGKFSPAGGQQACFSCNPGYFLDTEGETACKRCTLGRYSSEVEETACQECGPGQFADSEEMSACDPCPMGSFANRTGAFECTLCERGYFGTVVGLANCVPCAPGTESRTTGANACERCQAGSASVVAGSMCELCAIGRYSSVPSSTACTLCQRGRYGETTGLSECERCDLGTYAEGFGSSGCTGCNETHPGPVRSLTTMQPPTDEERANGIKIWRNLFGAVNRTSCGCMAGWQPVGDICEECGEGLICLGMGVLDIEVGYAWDGDLSVWDCSLGVEEACPGGEPGACKPGRNTQVIACAECLDNMVANGDGSCSKCEDADYLVPTLCCLFGVAIVVAAYILFDSPKRKRPKLSLILIGASMGQFVTVIQQLGIVSLIRVSYGGPLGDVFKTIMAVSFFDVQVLRPSCVMVMDVVSLYTLRVGMVFICLAVILFAHFVSQLVQHRHDWRTRWSTLACALGTVLLTFFVSILSTMLGPLQCKKHPNDRQTVSWYPSILCWEGGDHSTMLVIGCIACLLPLLFLALCIWAVRQFPRKLQKATTRFLNAWQFLFFRYTTKAYWYGPVVLVRNALVSIGPVMTSPVLQILFLEVIMLFSLMFLLRIMPWRLDKANFVDAAGHLTLLMVTMIASFFVDSDDQGSTRFVEIVGVLFILAIPAAILAAVLYGLLLFVRSLRRPFQFFLCHHKLGAGCFCRLLKMRLLRTRGVSRKVFIDTDDLKNLDTLFDIVAHSTETLVAICSQSLLMRPWCIGELATAHRNHISVAPIYLSGVMPCTEDFIENFHQYIGDVSGITQYQIDVPMIQDALRWFSKLSSMYLPQELHDQTLQSTCEALVSGRWQADKTVATSTEKIGDGTAVLIIADKADVESTSVAYILRDLINPVIQHKDGAVAGVLGLADKIPANATKGVLVCTNGVFTKHVLMTLVECLNRKSCIFPIIGTTNFPFPSEEWMMSNSTFLELEEKDRRKAVSTIQAIFTEIGVDFQPSALSGTEATLAIKAEEIAARMFAVEGLSTKVERAARQRNSASGTSNVIVIKEPKVSKSSRENSTNGMETTDSVPSVVQKEAAAAPKTNGMSEEKPSEGIEKALAAFINWETDCDAPITGYSEDGRGNFFAAV